MEPWGRLGVLVKLWLPVCGWVDGGVVLVSYFEPRGCFEVEFGGQMVVWGLLFGKFWDRLGGPGGRVGVVLGWRLSFCF